MEFHIFKKHYSSLICIKCSHKAHAHKRHVCKCSSYLDAISMTNSLAWKPDSYLIICLQYFLYILFPQKQILMWIIWMGLFLDKEILFFFLLEIIKRKKDLILGMNVQALPFSDVFLPWLMALNMTYAEEPPEGYWEPDSPFPSDSEGMSLFFKNEDKRYNI